MKKFFFILAIVSLTVPSQARYKMTKKGVVKERPAEEMSDVRVVSPKKEFDKNTVVDETETIQSLSKRFKVERSQLEYYRGINFGYEILVPALVISHDGQIEIGKVLQTKLEGYSWEQVCDLFYVNAETVDQEALVILKDLRKKYSKKIMTELPRTR